MDEDYEGAVIAVLILSEKLEGVAKNIGKCLSSLLSTVIMSCCSKTGISSQESGQLQIFLLSSGHSFLKVIHIVS